MRDRASLILWCSEEDRIAIDRRSITEENPPNFAARSLKSFNARRDQSNANAANANVNRSAPDHAMLDMTKDQLKAAPEFKYSR